MSASKWQLNRQEDRQKRLERLLHDTRKKNVPSYILSKKYFGQLLPKELKSKRPHPRKNFQKLTFKDNPAAFLIPLHTPPVICNDPTFTIFSLEVVLSQLILFHKQVASTRARMLQENRRPLGIDHSFFT